MRDYSEDKRLYYLVSVVKAVIHKPGDEWGLPNWAKNIRKKSLLFKVCKANTAISSAITHSYQSQLEHDMKESEWVIASHSE